ncbi:MAG: MATE family efflux transporter [Patescibacteria group bacterium]
MPQNRTADFAKGSIVHHLIVFSIPMFLGNLLQAFYNTVDTIWVGRFLGSDALAAVSIGFPVIFLLVSLIMGITMAATVMVAQFTGAKNGPMVRRVVANTLGLVVLSGAVVSVLGVVFHRAVLRLINTPPNLMHMASQYLSIFLSGLIFTFIYNAASSIMRGLGDSRTPTLYLVYATVLNIILDPLLIFGLGPFPRLGVAGAAWATVFAQAVSALLALRHLFKANGLIEPKLADYWPKRDLTLKTVGIGLPAGIQQIVVSFGALVIGALVNSFGHTAAASFGAAARLDQFSFLPAMTISLATSALVGQNLGAKDEKRAVETLKWSAIMGAAITGCVTLIVQAFPRQLLSVFTDDPGVLREGASYLRIVSLSYIPFSVMFAVNGLLRGAGDTLPTMFTSFAAFWFVRVPVATWLSRGLHLGTRGIWIGIALSPLVGLALSYTYYRTGRWRGKVITKTGPILE